MPDPVDPRGSSYPPVIGLTGRRHVGKSTVADHLVATLGFVRVHPFDGGKAAAAVYFQHLGASANDARRMVHGDLRDVPSALLPDRAPPRLFLERFGRFMGQDMGADWTLGAEIDRAWRMHPGRPLIVESVVFERPLIRAVGGIVVRVQRPGNVGPAGVCTDAVQAGLDVDATIVNDGDLAHLRRAITRIAQGMIGGS